MSGVIWLPEALLDVTRVHVFLKTKNTGAAKRVASLLQKGGNMLATYPEAGSPINGDKRELVMPFGAGAYVLRYRIANQTVFIIRVWHSKENRVE